MEPKQRFPKAMFDNQLKESAKRILDIYLEEAGTIPETCDKIYAMGRATGFKLGKFVKGDQGDKKKGAAGGNRRERKLKEEITELRQIVAKKSKEATEKRTKREKEIIKELSVLKTYEEEMSEMENFDNVWGDIWGREERTSNMTWRKEIRRQLNEKVNQVNQFNINFEKVKKDSSREKDG